MKKVLPVLCLALCVINVSAQKKLQQQLRLLVEGFNGEVGVYVKNLRAGAAFEFQADTIFPTASMIKLPIMLGIMDKINRGQLSDTQHVQYADSLLYEGVDILGSFKTG